MNILQADPTSIFEHFSNTPHRATVEIRLDPASWDADMPTSDCIISQGRVHITKFPSLNKEYVLLRKIASNSPVISPEKSWKTGKLGAIRSRRTSAFGSERI